MTFAKDNTSGGAGLGAGFSQANTGTRVEMVRTDANTILPRPYHESDGWGCEASLPAEALAFLHASLSPDQ